jgi:hypothetical protein
MHASVTCTFCLISLFFPHSLVIKVLRLLFLQFYTAVTVSYYFVQTISTNNKDSTQATKQFLTSHVTRRIPHHSFCYGAGHSIIANLHPLKLCYVAIPMVGLPYVLIFLDMSSFSRLKLPSGRNL